MRHSEKVDPLITFKNPRILLDQPPYKQDRTLTVRTDQVGKLTAQRNPNPRVLPALQMLLQNGQPSVMLGWGSTKQSISHRRKGAVVDRKSTRLNSSHRCISYAVFCLKKTTSQSAVPEPQPAFPPARRTWQSSATRPTSAPRPMSLQLSRERADAVARLLMHLGVSVFTRRR